MSIDYRIWTDNSAHAGKSNGIYKLLLTIIGKLWDCACCGRKKEVKKVFWILKCAFKLQSNQWLSIQGGAYFVCVKY